MFKISRQAMGTTAVILLAACDSTSVGGGSSTQIAPELTTLTTVQSDFDSAAAQDSDSVVIELPAIEVVETIQQQEPSATPEPEFPAYTTPSASQPQNAYNAADITDLILVTGQSNALGTQTQYDDSLDVPHQRAFAFTNAGWRQADLHQVWDRNWFPGKNNVEAPSNNFAFHMARNTAIKDSARVVGFILVTDPGQRIENWQLNGAFWQTIEARVLDAINQLPHKIQLDGILWHQGESNAGESDYHQKLDQLIANFRTQSWFSANKPFICGETATYHSINQQLMALNNNGDHWTGCVQSNGLTTQPDGFHFDAAGLRELGRRYADKYLEMTR